jgi:predicted component of type VI protein secretion system
MADLTKTLRDFIKDLSDLQNKLAVIVHNVSIANTAIQAINAALTAAAKIADAA